MKRLSVVATAVAIALFPPPAHPQAPSARPVWRPVIMGTQAMIAAEHPVEHHQAGIGSDAFILTYIANQNRVVSR